MEMKNKCEISIAPFVRKTYQLVSNRLTDDIVVWGINNNSFIIFDPMFFSQQVLPAYFKHNNFTSYIRQLNDYGFRKVDPDRWEFANQWFLKGQEQLLCNITRKLKSSKSVGYKREHEMDEQQELREEVSRLKEKQRQLEEELHRMSRCIEAIETRLEPMMTLLYKDQPQLLINDGTMLHNGNKKQLMLGEKKRRTVMCTDATPCSYNSSSMAISSEEEDDWAVGVISSSTNYDQFVSHGVGVEVEVDNKLDSFHILSAPASYDNAVAVAVAAAEEVDGGHTQPHNQIPYPFSLLEGGF